MRGRTLIKCENSGGLHEGERKVWIKQAGSAGIGRDGGPSAMAIPLGGSSLK